MPQASPASMYALPQDTYFYVHHLLKLCFLLWRFFLDLPCLFQVWPHLWPCLLLLDAIFHSSFCHPPANFISWPESSSEPAGSPSAISAGNMPEQLCFHFHHQKTAPFWVKPETTCSAETLLSFDNSLLVIERTLATSESWALIKIHANTC